MGEGHLYRVGDLFDPDRTTWPQGSHLWLDSDGDTRLAISLTGPSRREISAVESGTPRFAWTEQGVNGFLLFKYGDSPWNDAPFNPHRLSEPFAALPIPRGTHSRTFTFLVHADTGRIAAMRMFTWPAYFLNHVVGSVHRLAARDSSDVAAHTALQDFYRPIPRRTVAVPPRPRPATRGHVHRRTTRGPSSLTSNRSLAVAPRHRRAAIPADRPRLLRPASSSLDACLSRTPAASNPGGVWSRLLRDPRSAHPGQGCKPRHNILAHPVSLRLTPRSSGSIGACAPAPMCGL